jgi:2-dehydropantoate 2-reductase
MAATVSAMSASSPEQPRKTVAVVGLGSIGGVAAGCLAGAGRHEVVACVRQPIARLTPEAPAGAVDLPLRTLNDPAEAAPADWVLLCTKAHHTQAAAPWLTRLCGASTRVAVLQNGIDHIARVAPLAGGAAVVPVMVSSNGERLAPDRVRLRHAGAHDLLAADDEAGAAFAQLFAGTELRVVLTDDFLTLAWRKLFLNAVAACRGEMGRSRFD